MFSASDYAHMAHKPCGWPTRVSTAPAPTRAVGCVLVRDGRVVGEGWHERAGAPHAEINALAAAGDAARGATATLRSSHAAIMDEPAVHGRADKNRHCQARGGNGRPKPLVSGGGCAKLQAAGIEVQTGLMANEARTLNIGFIARMSRERPWVRAEIAASLDGKTALNNGTSQWITSEAARCDGTGCGHVPARY